MLHRFSIVYLLIFIPLISFSQDDPGEVKFGDITTADRQLTVAPGDSSADAYVLYDLLDMSLVLDPTGSPMLKEKRHRRVKLLRESSFDHADVELGYYRKSQGITGLKAIIHLPDGGVKKLGKSDFIREHLNEDYDTYKFTFPNVAEGAIIEYTYTKTSDGITIPARYYFQEDIPVRWAEYRASIPAYFNYVSLGNASNYTINEVDVVNRRFGNGNAPHREIRWAYGDLPAYDEQPYVNNFSDYIPQVRFQLQSVAYPNQPVQEIFTNWKETTKDLDLRSDFGKIYRHKSNYGKVWKAVEPLLADAASKTDEAVILYNFVAGKISWNGQYSWLVENTPNKVFEAAEGSSGEKSMMLLALLREAGIDAHPLILPLRDGGTPLELYPLMAQFDHLMVLANISGKLTIMDPNDVSRPPGLPRVKALNHRAFVADPDNPHWIDIIVPRASQVVMANVALDEEGLAEVDIQSRLQSYFAFNGRNQIKEMEQDFELPIVEDVVEVFPEAELLSHEIKDAAEVSGPLSMDLKLQVPMGQAIDDYLYLQPILCPVLEKGLVDVEERIYPVDFAYPWQQRYITSIAIPDGFAVEELPQSVRLRSEDNTLQCVFAAAEKPDRTISINFTVTLDRTVYQPGEYAGLRDMFRRIIEMQESTIVLKRAK